MHSENDTSDETVTYQQASFLQLFSFIRELIIHEQQIMRLTDINNEFTKYMQENGVTSVTRNTKNHLKRKLETEFGDTIHFVNHANSRLILYPDSLTMSKLVVDYVQMNDRLLHLKTLRMMLSPNLQYL